MSRVDANSNLVATVVQGHTFTIDRRYQPGKILGRGSFGVVCTAFDNVRQETIAIKRIRPFANDEWDARHTLREIRLMKLLGRHPNVIALYGLSIFDEKAELYMSMELMDCDLHRIIQSKQPLNDMHYKCFARQMLEGIKAMHEIGVFHRDLKPGNLLVSKDCQLRITDFGLARFMDEDTLSGNNRQNPLTEYVVTRWYRCPELLLSPTQPYSAAIDIWSIGCIIGELIKRKPLFPGKSHANQVQLILEVRGYHGPADLGFELSSEATSFLDRRCRYSGKSLASFIPQASPEALELLEVLMDLNPNRRPSAAEALEYPYIQDAQVLCEYSEDTMPRRVDEKFFDFEREDYSLEQLQAMVREEVNRPCDDSIFLEPSPIKKSTSLSRQASGNQHPTHGRTESDAHATEADEGRVEYSRSLQRSDSTMSEGDGGPNPKSLSRSKSAPPSPSPQKVEMIAKQEKKHKRRFFLQGLQRLKQDQEVAESSSSRVEKDSSRSSGRIERYGSGSEDLTSRRDRVQPQGVVRGGSVLQHSSSSKASKYIQRQDRSDSYGQTSGGQSQLFSQFNHMGFSSQGVGATQPTRKVASAPVADSRVTRLPALQQRGSKHSGYR
mmetsp:Transcript_9741/g.14691  ORF Transcript_9741/g.14691 Transcript_9741/m.14691 type:complete len:610 (-) Transcript_9741:213-2042(-)|eukprot:CAMPEP_0185018870 /NCGR_PEP_ID=MMETSP1103-20130426/1546_1 /TAXON_ID=36769 /ORGANISM="Paraphysomonas bandaiensis, Strain Caron Lab Isolate" /LENGTH=609 /DNA_ID=CAMNT_0027548901 /DNA_START=246 /DNA_END=2075 /DNA_ORIENTATION=-